MAMPLEKEVQRQRNAGRGLAEAFEARVEEIADRTPATHGECVWSWEGRAATKHLLSH